MNINNGKGNCSPKEDSFAGKAITDYVTTANNSYWDVKNLKSKHVHVPKECLVTDISSLSNDAPLQVVSAFSSCK